MLLFGLISVQSLPTKPHKKGGHAHTVPTYFRRQDSKGHLISRHGPDYGKLISKPVKEDILDFDLNNAVLKVKPFIVKNGDEVTVQWSGVSNPNQKDWIAIVCPHYDKIDRKLDHFFVDESPSWMFGHGTHKVHVFNLRNDCEFRYFRNAGHSRLVARSNKIAFEFGADAPLQGRIAVTGDATQMRIMWTAAKCKFRLHTGLCRLEDLENAQHLVLGKAKGISKWGLKCELHVNFRMLSSTNAHISVKCAVD